MSSFFIFLLNKRMDYHNSAGRKRPRYSMNSSNAGPLQHQRTSTWGIYSSNNANIDPAYPQQNAIINLPPAQVVLMTELGGNEDIKQFKGGEMDIELSAGLGGCQRVISDGFYDTNGYYNFTEENCFVQLLAYRFRPNPSDTTKQFVECISCYIDMGTLKLSIEENNNLKPEIALKRLQEELCFALTGQQCIGWPRFCMWNSSRAPSNTYRSSDCKPWMPQGNPVDNSFGNDGFALFQQTIPPLLTVTLTGCRQITINLNPDYVDYCTLNYGKSDPWFFQLMTPRINGILDQGSIPMNGYVNPSFIDGNHGWFERGPFCFGFGFLNYNTGEYVDIYKLNNWTISNFTNTIGNDFNVNPITQINYDVANPWSDIYTFCQSRYLQATVVASMPCTLCASRFYFIRSRELSLNQVKPFVGSTSQSGPVDTMAILWDEVLEGNRRRDITGTIGEDNGTCTNFTKELNPLYNQNRVSIQIIDEWATNSLVGGSNIGNRTLQNEYADSDIIKDNAVYKAIYAPLFYTILDQNANPLDPILSGFPYTIYSPYAPRWITSTSPYNVQFDVRRYCRNRCLLTFKICLNDPFNWQTIPGDISTFLPYDEVVTKLWGTSRIEDGEEKPGNDKVLFMSLIGFK